MGGEEWEKYLKITRRIANESLFHIRDKQRKYLAIYEKRWSQYKIVEEKLVKLAWEMAHIKYETKMDYLEYHPFVEKKRETTKAILKTISRVDKLNSYLNYEGFVNYLLEHSFIHINSEVKESCCIYNARFNTSDVLVKRKNSMQDVFDAIHEIGHAYYNSYRMGCDWDDYTSEVFSLLSEIRLMKVLMNDKTQKYDKVIEERLQGIFIGMFSLDLYEKEVLRLEEITVKNILDVRRRANIRIFGNIDLRNDQYSQYNLFLNSEMVVGLRDVYLYPMAMLMAIYLDMKISEHPEYEKELVEKIKEEQKSFSIKELIDFSDEKNINDAVDYCLLIWKKVVGCNGEEV